MSVPKIRHDWYQTETHVIVTILLKNSENVKVVYGENMVCKIVSFNFSYVHPMVSEKQCISVNSRHLTTLQKSISKHGGYNDFEIDY